MAEAILLPATQVVFRINVRHSARGSITGWIRLERFTAATPKATRQGATTAPRLRQLLVNLQESEDAT